MSTVFEARDIFIQAFPPRRYGKLDNVFYQAVRFISPRVHKEFTVRRARSIYEGTARRIDSEEMDALRAARIEELKREYTETRARLEILDRKIASLGTGTDSPLDAGQS
jgi:hypothetical protein